jgi:hypothetical protein
MSEATKLYNLQRMYDGIREDSDFSSFEAFFDWADGKYKAGHTIYKLCDSKPHSPKNSYWYYISKKPPDDIKSPICENCDKTMMVCNNVGCARYRELFVKNWDENICIKPKVVQETKEYFRYEHPDLVREGVVFHAEC